jgi:hypothetical protein
MSVCPSACVSSAPTGRIFMKFDNGDFHPNTFYCCRRHKIASKSLLTATYEGQRCKRKAILRFRGKVFNNDYIIDSAYLHTKIQNKRNMHIVNHHAILCGYLLQIYTTCFGLFWRPSCTSIFRHKHH